MHALLIRPPVAEIAVVGVNEGLHDASGGQTCEPSDYQSDAVSLAKDESLTHETVLPDHSDSRQTPTMCVGSKIVINTNDPTILDEPIFTGRKGIVYDWQKLLMPTDSAFETSLQILLNAGKDDSAQRYA